MQLFKKKRDSKLLKAVASNNIEALDKILKVYSADQLSEVFTDGHTLIDTAVMNDAAEALKRIVTAGAHFTSQPDKTFLCRALQSPLRLSMLKSLILAGIDLVEHKQVLIGQGLEQCAQDEVMLFLTTLSQQGIDIDTADENGNNAMDFALKKQDLALINYLIGSGSKERDNWPSDTPIEIVDHIKRRYEDLKIQAAFLSR